MNRILLAEDDNDMRRFLAKALANAGYDVVSYDNGRSAYERLREEPFTLLLTDIVMPEMDGIELARRATELDPDLKVMFITGYTDQPLEPGLLQVPGTALLIKPFELSMRTTSCATVRAPLACTLPLWLFRSRVSKLICPKDTI